MATFLDVGMLGYFNIIFYFLFLFVLLFAIMQAVKFPTGDKNLSAILAFLVAILVVFSGPTREMISVITPTFFVIIFFLFFGILIYRFIGATDADVKSFLGTEAATRTFLLIILGIIILSTLGKTFFSGNSETSENEETDISSGNSNVGTQGEGALVATLTHPKILGLVLILLIGAFAMSLLSRNVK
ncbi:MAG: hypothetical protein PHV16_01955 [Candidatus Nanoarchaeia archaeon]|nr:hypothetical protein [Candidatus Nanoarchaeia archaeon]